MYIDVACEYLYYRDQGRRFTTRTLESPTFTTKLNHDVNDNIEYIVAFTFLRTPTIRVFI